MRSFIRIGRAVSLVAMCALSFSACGGSGSGSDSADGVVVSDDTDDETGDTANDSSAEPEDGVSDTPETAAPVVGDGSEDSGDASGDDGLSGGEDDSSGGDDGSSEDDGAATGDDDEGASAIDLLLAAVPFDEFLSCRPAATTQVGSAGRVACDAGGSFVDYDIYLTEDDARVQVTDDRSANFNSTCVEQQGSPSILYCGSGNFAILHFLFPGSGIVTSLLVSPDMSDGLISANADTYRPEDGVFAPIGSPVVAAPPEPDLPEDPVEPTAAPFDPGTENLSAGALQSASVQDFDVPGSIEAEAGLVYPCSDDPAFADAEVVATGVGLETPSGSMATRFAQYSDASTSWAERRFAGLEGCSYRHSWGDEFVDFVDSGFADSGTQYWQIAWTATVDDGPTIVGVDIYYQLGRTVAAFSCGVVGGGGPGNDASCDAGLRAFKANFSALLGI